MVKRARIHTSAIPAPFWKRLVAYFIDTLLLDLVVALPFRGYFITYENMSFRELISGAQTAQLGGIVFIIALLSLAYWVILEYKMHQTLGKMLMKIYVLPQNLTLAQALLRNVTKIFQLALIIDVLYMLFKRGHQRLFEKFSNTQVVEYTWKI